MSTKLTVAAALAGTLLATCLVAGSAQATSVPVLKGDATPGIVTLVGHGGGGGHGVNRYAYNRYAYGGHHGYYDHHRHYGYYGRYRHYGYYGYYGYPYYSYGYYGGGCGWLYRNAVATGSPYWWNRYYQCTGYY
jgi:hypothetical protein